MVNATTNTNFLMQLIGDRGSTTSTGRSGSSISEQFAQALRDSLETLGLSSDKIQVNVQETSDNQASGLGSQLVVTLQAAETASAPAESGGQAVRNEEVETGDWKDMLDGNLTASTLETVADPALLLNSRLDKVRGSSSAVIANSLDGTGQPLNASWLSSRDQADAMIQKLQSLGIDASDVEELQMTAGPFGIEYGDERRAYLVNGMDVAMLMERYAKYPVEVADTMTLDEWRGMA